MRDWEPRNKKRKEKTLVDRMFDQMYALTPRKGYNLVRIDPWSIPDDDDALTLVGHFDTYTEAEQALMKYGKHNVTIYGPQKELKKWLSTETD